MGGLEAVRRAGKARIARSCGSLGGLVVILRGCSDMIHTSRMGDVHNDT